MTKSLTFDDFHELCKRSDLVATHQRFLIYQAVMTLHDNPTPEEVFEHVKRNMPSISLATVYKNIDTFVDHRMMKDISPNYGSRRIESASARHDHFVCRVCRRVFDLKKHTELVPPRRSDLPEGASFEYHLVELVGLCRGCARHAETRKGSAGTSAD